MGSYRIGYVGIILIIWAQINHFYGTIYHLSPIHDFENLMFSPSERKEHNGTDKAAIKIQSSFKGYVLRKKNNIYGRSQGKEIEVYLPLGVKKRNAKTFSYDDMIGQYKTILCKSELFYLQIDYMRFGLGRKVSIAEIVTTPFRQTGEDKSNLRTEKEIDDAVADFIRLLENFTKESSAKTEPSFFPLEEVLIEYNKIHPRYPLRMNPWLVQYLKKPECRDLFSGRMIPVVKHQNINICFIYDSNCTPNFSLYRGPRTDSATSVISLNEYKSGTLLVHVQITFSMPIQDYKPEIMLILRDLGFNHTSQQIEFLQEARNRAERFVLAHPLPSKCDREKILGMLTICVEHIITLANAREYKGLHEKADRPVFSFRHILHYVKQNICNETEIKWFEEMFIRHFKDIQRLLCRNEYTPDYKGNEGAYGHASGFAKKSRYDVIFDLFGDFSNKKEIGPLDEKKPYLTFNADEYGITSWETLFDNHLSLSGRTHLQLQKVITADGKIEHHPLFEARRLPLMTIQEFRAGKSRIQPPSEAVAASTAKFHQLFSNKSEPIEVVDGGCKLPSGPIKLWSFK
jgi:hypothetical protein